MLLDLDNIVKFSDDLSGEYTGVVVSNDDPLNLGRVKCTIEGLLEFDEALLPFCQSATNSKDFQIVPQVGDKIIIKFKERDIYHPFYVGYKNTTVNHNSDFDDPKTLGISRSGFKIKYNTQSEIFEILTPVGNQMLFKKNGDLMFVAKKDFVVQADGKIDLKSTSDASIVTDAMAKFAGKGGTTLGDQSSTTQVLGTTILLGQGGLPAATLLCQTVGVGNLSAPVFSMIIEGSSIVLIQK